MFVTMFVSGYVFVCTVCDYVCEWLCVLSDHVFE